MKFNLSIIAILFLSNNLNADPLLKIKKQFEYKETNVKLSLTKPKEMEDFDMFFDTLDNSSKKIKEIKHSKLIKNPIIVKEVNKSKIKTNTKTELQLEKKKYILKNKDIIEVSMQDRKKIDELNKVLEDINNTLNDTKIKETIKQQPIIETPTYIKPIKTIKPIVRTKIVEKIIYKDKEVIKEVIIDKTKEYQKEIYSNIINLLKKRSYKEVISIISNTSLDKIDEEKLRNIKALLLAVFSLHNQNIDLSSLYNLKDENLINLFYIDFFTKVSQKTMIDKQYLKKMRKLTLILKGNKIISDRQSYLYIAQFKILTGDFVSALKTLTYIKKDNIDSRELKHKLFKTLMVYQEERFLQFKTTHQDWSNKNLRKGK